MFEIVTVATGLSEDSTTARLAARLAAATASALETTAPEVTVTEINLRTLAKEMVTMTVSGLPSPALDDAFAAVQRADALITVAPIYKSQPVGLQTLFFQLIDDAALAGTPVLIGSTGGTARHSLAAETSLRPLLSYLKAIIVPTAVFAATDDWGADTSGMGERGGLAERITAAGAELADLVRALRPAAAGEEAGETTAGEEAAGPGLPELELAPGETEAQQRGGDRQHAGDRPRFAAQVATPAVRRGPVDALDPNAVTPFAELLRS